MSGCLTGFALTWWYTLHIGLELAYWTRIDFMIYWCLSSKVLTEAAVQEKVLGKGVLKICSKFTGEHPCRSVISIKLQSNFCTQTTLLDLDWFYVILDLDLKYTWTDLLDSDWFYYKQRGKMSEKYESLLELFVKQLLLTFQSSLASSISLWCVKNQMLILFIAKLRTFQV